MKKTFLKIMLLISIVLSVQGFQIIYSQNYQRIPLIGSQAPQFTAPTTMGMLSFPGDFGNAWKILFSHPRDFTPVCSSEILELANKQDEFKKMGAQIVILSVDKMASHKSWKADLESVSYKGREPLQIYFPLVVDSSSAISRSYGMMDANSEGTQSVRGVFFIDPENEIRAFQFYPNEVGRNTDEILRILKALQTQQNHQNIVIPANWQPGDDVMIPFLSEEDKKELQKPEPSVHYINWYMIFRKLK